MLPDPLHPAVVHFPIVLTMLLPVAAAGALWAIGRGSRPWRAWGIPVAVAAGLTASAWVAVRTGNGDEERVEPVVTEAAVESHEESAEAFLVLTGVALAIMAIGLADGLTGRAARVVATAATLVLVVAAVRVGHSGGELVYRHGAAAAYTAAAPAFGPSGINPGESRRDRDDR